jgi:hypothetical protein
MKTKVILVSGIVAILASGIMYLIDFIVFRDSHNLLMQLVDNIAFIPIYVFIVSVVIERLLNRQEKLSIRYKMNMVVGIFFSEIGNTLIRKLLPSYERNRDIVKIFSVSNNWTRDDFKRARASSSLISETPSDTSVDFNDLKILLTSKREFLLTLLENQNLIEHEEFSDLLWAIFHLTEELEARSSVSNLSEADIHHLEGDVGRLYGHLLYQWLTHVEHLKDKYPYLFSLAIRMSPFLDNPSATII